MLKQAFADGLKEWLGNHIVHEFASDSRNFSLIKVFLSWHIIA